MYWLTFISAIICLFLSLFLVFMLFTGNWADLFEFGLGFFLIAIFLIIGILSSHSFYEYSYKRVWEFRNTTVIGQLVYRNYRFYILHLDDGRYVIMNRFWDTSSPLLAEWPNKESITYPPSTGPNNQVLQTLTGWGDPDVMKQIQHEGSIIVNPLEEKK